MATDPFKAVKLNDPVAGGIGAEAIDVVMGPVDSTHQVEGAACALQPVDSSVKGTVAKCNNTNGPGGGFEAAFVDDGGAFSVNGTNVACQNFRDCPPPSPNFPGNQTFSGAGFLFTNVPGTPAGSCLDAANNPTLCSTSWAQAPSDLTSLIGLDSSNGLNSFDMHIFAENTKINGFQAEIFLTFKYPRTSGPVVSARADCLAGQVVYTISGLGPLDSGLVTGSVNGIPLPTNFVPPSSAPPATPFPIPAGQTTGTLSVTATINGIPYTSGNVPFDCSGGGGSPPGGATGSASCIFPPTFSPSLPFDPGESVTIKVGVNYTPPSGSSGTLPGPPGHAATTYSQGSPAPAITLTSPFWAVGTQNTTSFATFPAIVPANQFGAFDVNWTFTWTQLITNWTAVPQFITVEDQPPTDPPTFHQQFVGYTYVISSQQSVPQQKPCKWPGSINPPGSAQAIYDRPYMKVYGGDVSVGKGFADGTGACTTNPSSPGAIYGWNTAVHIPSTFYGAGAEFATHALADIRGFASAQASASNTAPPAGWALTFANVGIAPAPSGDNMGGQAGSVPCLYDFFGHMPKTGVSQVQAIPPSALDCQVISGPPEGTGQTMPHVKNLNLLTSGNYFVDVTGPNPYGCHDNLLWIDHSQINVGEQITVYVKGDVLIDAGSNTSDITYNLGNWTVATLPSLRLIVQGNIYIDTFADQLDGLYVAQPNCTVLGACTGGNIYDCTMDQAHIDDDVARYYPSCPADQLLVNGAFIANTYKPMRMIGTFEENQDGTSKVAPSTDKDPSGVGTCTLGNVGSGYGGPSCPNAGEVFNYGPELWLAPNPTISQPISPQSSIDAVTSLPPIL